MVMMRKVLSSDSGRMIKCVWCHMQGENRDGFEMHKSIFHEHARELPCDHPLSKHVNYLFCSERHKQYFRNSHIQLGVLPAGFRSVI